MPKEIFSLYYKTFSSQSGKKVLEDLEKHCTFTPNTQDSNDVFMRLGKQELLKYIKYCIERSKDE